MKNNRLFGIIYLLLKNDTLTAQYLADYFEVSKRTIYRDIEVLSSLNIPIYMNKGKNGGIHLLENYKFDKSLLTDKEQNQILFSLEGINKFQIESKNTYEKLKNIFAKEDENWFEVDFSVWDNSIEHKENFEKIKTAIINKNILTFSYFSSYGNHTKRKVEPLKLYFKYNSWYLYSYDIEKKDFRYFKIMRMKELEISEETFEKTLKETKKEMKKKVDKPPKIVKLTLQISSELAYRVYDEFDAKKIQKQEDGNFLVNVEFPLTTWVYGYLLSFGEHLKIIEPEYIKKEIINQLQKSLKNYM